MPITVKYFIADSQGNPIDWTNRTGVAAFDIEGKEAVVYGSAGIDAVYVQAWTSADLTQLGTDPDKIYLSGNLANYNQTIDQDTGAYTFTRTGGVGGRTEVVKVLVSDEDDVLHFADGQVSLNGDTNSALHNGTAYQPIAAVSGAGTPATPSELGQTTTHTTPTKVFITDSAGLLVPMAPQMGQALKIFGSAGADGVYVRAGTKVDATELGADNDKVYLTGNLADYTQSIDQETGVYTFSRSLGGVVEEVKVTLLDENDELHFADGHVVFNQMRTDITLHDGTSYQAITAPMLSQPGTPGLAFDFSNKTATEIAAYLNDSVNAAKLVTLSTAQGQQIDADDLDQVGTAAFAALSPNFIDGLSAQVVASLPNELLHVMTSAQAAVADLSSLTGPQVLQLLPEAIDSVLPGVIDNLSAAEIKALSNEHLTALTSDQAAAIGAAGGFAELTPAQMVRLSSVAIDSLPNDKIDDMGATFVQLSDPQIQALTPGQVGYITAAQITALNTADPTRIVALGVDIEFLSNDAYNALTTEQVNALTSEQKAALAGRMRTLTDQPPTLSTNLVINSEAFGETASGHGTPLNALITQNVTAAPVGVLGADKMAESNTQGDHYIVSNAVLTLDADSPYTYSIYVKANGRDSVQIRQNTSNFVGALGAIFDLTGEGSVRTTATGSTAQIFNAGDGWYRISVSAVTISTPPGYERLYLYLDNQNGATYTGDGSSGVYFWGAQIEKGAVASVYVPTGASAGTVIAGDGVLNSQELINGFTVNVDASNAQAGDKVELLVNGAPLASPVYSSVLSGPTSNVRITVPNGADLPDTGAVNFSVRLVNALGLVGAATTTPLTLTVDTSSAETIAGTSLADRIKAGAGDDIVVHSAGADTVDGGAGRDSYRMAAGAALDLVSGSVILSNMEVVDLETDTAANTLTLNASKVLSSASANSVNSSNGWASGSYTSLSANMATFKQLVVDGSAADVLNLVGGWNNLGTITHTATSATYNVWQNTANDAQVIVKNTVGAQSLVVPSAEDIANMSVEQFQALGTQVLSSLGTDAVHAIRVDQIRTLDTSEILALTANIELLSDQALAALTSDQAAAIGAAGGFADLTNAQVARLDPTAIDSVPPGVIDNLSAAEIKALSNEHLTALTSDQAAAIGAAGGFAELTPAQMVRLSSVAIDSLPNDKIDDMGATFVQLSDPQIQALTPGQVGYITAAQITALNTADPTRIVALGVDIEFLSNDAYNALTTEQVNALTSEQKAALAGRMRTLTDQPPVITGDSVLNSQELINGFTVNVDASNAQAGDKVELLVNGAPLASPVYSSVLSGPNSNVSITVPNSADLPDTGAVNFTVRLVNALGLVGAATTVPLTLTVDTSSAETIAGTSLADRIKAGAGDDIVVHSAGADTVDGGAGRDSYRMAAGAALDLVSGSVILSNMEVVDLETDTAANTLTLNASKVLSSASANSVNSSNGWASGSYTSLSANMATFKQLVVDGSAADVLNLVGGWNNLGTITHTATSATYNVWQNTANDAQVIVKNTMVVEEPTAFSMAQIPAGQIVDGETANDQLGRDVAALGDINGDGYGDFVVGARNYSAGTGKAYIYHGGVSNMVLAATVTGEVAGSQFTEEAVAVIGDFNGDGINDMAFGAYAVGDFDAGRAYVMLGSKTLSGNTNATTFDGNGTGFQINGTNDLNAWLGYSINTAGDFNGDGLADLVIGAYGNSNDIGKAYVVFGSSSNLSNVDLSSPTFTSSGRGLVISAAAAGTFKNNKNFAIGDVNGDGLTDLFVAEDGMNSSPSGSGGGGYVVFGTVTREDISLADVATGNGGFKVIGDPNLNLSMGTHSAAAGDVNGDGLADLYIGPGVIVFGRTSTSPVNLASLSAAEGLRLINQPTSTSVEMLTSAGDMNGDGLSDFFVTARNTSTNASYGYLIFGRTTGGDIDLSRVMEERLGGLYIKEYQPNSSIGTYGTMATEDINGDGINDLIIGARAADPSGRNNAGQAYVLFGGSALGVANAVNFTGDELDNSLTGTSVSETFVSGAGNDVLVGNGGADVMYGGMGNDIFVLNSSNAATLEANFGVAGNTTKLSRINGGTGTDTLRLAEGTNLNLTLVSNAGAGMPGVMSRIESIEIIDMRTDSAANALTLKANDVVDMSSMNLFNSINGWTGLAASVARHQLLVDGGANDSLTITGNWTMDAGSVSNGGNTYTVYNHNSVAAQILVDSDVQVGQTLTGSGVAGPMIAALNVKLYDTAGNLLKSTTTDANGHFSAEGITYRGAMLIVMEDANDANGTPTADYQDEFTGNNVDLTTNLRAVVNFTGADTDLSVTPLTELAVRKMNLTGNQAPADVDFITAVNAQVAEAFGVADMLDKVVAVNDAGYDTAGSAQAQLYGKMLGALSLLDSVTGSMENTLTKTAAHLQLVTDGNGAVTDAKLSNSLAPGVALAKSAMDAYVGANSGEETAAAAVVLTGYMTTNTLAQQDLNGHFYAANPVFPV